jgi:hypothetical protein
MDVSFKDIDRLRQVYNPEVVEKAAYATVKQLQARASTEVSRAVRKTWNISAGAVKSTLKQRIRYQGSVPAGYLIYLSKRQSLRHFATKTAPKVKTARGVRYGARVKVRKDRPTKIVQGGFFGKAKTSDAVQIFQRIGLSRTPIKKLTAPAIAQMVGGRGPLRALNELIQKEADVKFSNNLDHFLQKKIGLR